MVEGGLAADVDDVLVEEVVVVDVLVPAVVEDLAGARTG